MKIHRSLLALVALFTFGASTTGHAQEHRRRGTMVGSSDDADALLAQAAADYAAAGVAMKQASDLDAVAAQLRQQTLDQIGQLFDIAIQKERSAGTTEKYVGRGLMVLGGVVGIGATIAAAPMLPVVLAVSGVAIGVGAYGSRAGRTRVDDAEAAAALRRAGASDQAVLDALYGANVARASSTSPATAPAPSTATSTANDGFHH